MTEAHPDRQPTELELARQRLHRSRADLHQQFRGSSESGAGPAPLLRGVAMQALSALTSGRAGSGGGLRLGLAVAAMLMYVLSKRGSRAGGLGLLLSLMIAGLRFARRR